MILATHALIGAAAGRPFAAHPLTAFLAGFATHYLGDAIPHWDYRLASFPDEKNSEKSRWELKTSAFKKDLLRVGIDGAFGLILVLLIAPSTNPVVTIPLLLGAFGGMAPDLLQGIYFTGYAPFLKPLQKFHDFCHTKIRLGPYPMIGIPFQIAIALLAAYFLGR